MYVCVVVCVFMWLLWPIYRCICQLAVKFVRSLWSWRIFDTLRGILSIFACFGFAFLVFFLYFSYSLCVFSYFWFFGICIYFMHVVRVFVKKPQMRRIFHFCAVFCCFSRCSRKTRFSSHLDALVSVQQPQQTLQVSSWSIIFSCSHSTHMFSTREQKTLNPAQKRISNEKWVLKSFSNYL